MTDDLIERLRYYKGCKLCLEAADEIERLRAELAQTKDYAWKLGEALKDDDDVAAIRALAKEGAEQSELATEVDLAKCLRPICGRATYALKYARAVLLKFEVRHRH